MATWQMHRPWAPRTVAQEAGDRFLPHWFLRTRPTYWPRSLYLHSPVARPFALPRPDALRPPCPGPMPAVFSRTDDRLGEHALEWERARCISLPARAHYSGSDEAARCTRGHASEGPRPPQDRGAQGPARQGRGPLRGERVHSGRCALGGRAIQVVLVRRPRGARGSSRLVAFPARYVGRGLLRMEDRKLPAFVY